VVHPEASQAEAVVQAVVHPEASQAEAVAGPQEAGDKSLQFKTG
jgi:hypothetical protein